VVNKIDDKHLPRAKPPAMEDLFRVKINQTRFRASNNQTSPRHRKTARPKPVAIQHSTNDLTVAERDGRRPIPRFSAIRVVPQK
jgi:hypothetical protein